MNTKNWLILVVAFVSLLFNKALAQNDCPGLPSRAKFDTLGYISANIPTDPVNPAGKLYLGQGWAQRGSVIRPGFIPSNKPSWAIAIAVAWNLARNINQRVEYPNMGYWMATLIQETELRCATDLTWDDPSHVPDAYNPNTVYAAQINNGCLQIEGPGNAWSALQQAYPNGRIPTSSNPGDNTSMYDQLIEGVDGFEASAITKTYYDLYTSQIFNYNVGWDFYENVDCKMKHDPYAYVKMSASNYNGGPNAFLNAEGILNDTGPGCWTGLPATTAGYANDIAKWVSVVENNTSYCEYPAGSSFGGYYDGAVAYSEVTKYLNIIKPMFGDVDFVNEVIPYVEAAFIAKAGSLGGIINFTDFGEVIDAIVLHLPMDKPTAVEGTPIGINLGCTGDYLPYGHVDIINGTTTMCLGKSVTLELMVDAGNDPNIQYKWFKGDVVTGTLIGTNKQVTVTPNALGTDVYSGQICNSNGCYTVYSNTQNACQDPRDINGFTVTANDCKLCPFIASGTSVNAVCKGTPDGSINLELTNFPADYLVTYIATTPVGNDTVSFETSGGTVQMDGVRDGAYNFELQDLSDPTCIAYTTVLVGYDTEINEYIDADLLGITNCQADLGAKIKEQPTPCLWKVEVHAPTYFVWERWVNAVVTTSTGKTLIQKDTRLAPRGEFDDWNAVQMSEFWLSLNTGDQITIGTAVARTPGAYQIYDYEFRIIDENNDLDTAITAPAGGATFDGNYVGAPYTVTCPEDVSNYSIAWAPSINNEVTTAIQTTGDVIVQSTDRVYTVTATNTDNPQCILKDSVIVPGDLSCGSACANPGKATLVNDSDIGLSDTVLSCTDSTLYVKLDGNDAGTFLYELYLNDEAQTPTNTTGEFVISNTGEYYVLVSDDADAGNTDCRVYSDTIQFIKQIVPNAPLYKDGDTIVCAGAKGDLIQVSTALSATSYTWKYSGTGLTFNPIPLDSSATLDFADNSTDGVLTIIGENSCGADSLELSITVGSIPVVDLGADTITICATSPDVTFDAGNTGATFNWSSGETSQSIQKGNGNQGDYYVIVTEKNCSDSDTVHLKIATELTVDLGVDLDVCTGTTIDLDAGFGVGFTFDWNESGAIATQTFTTGEGKVTVLVADAGGCEGKDTITITEVNPLQIDLGVDQGICLGDEEISFSMISGRSDLTVLRWNDLSTGLSLSTKQEGIYWLEVDSAGCVFRDSVTLKVNALPSVNLGADTFICTGTTPTITLNGGIFVSYQWADLTNLIPLGISETQDVSAVGIYTLNVVDTNGCIYEDTIVVAEELGTAFSVSLDTSICPAGSAKINVPNNLQGVVGASWQWLIDNSTGTNYSVDNRLDGDRVEVILSYTNEFGCVTNDTSNVSVNNNLPISLKDTAVCAGEDITFVSGYPSVGYTFAWFGGSTGNDLSLTAVTNGDAGSISLSITSDEGCAGDTTIDFAVNAIPDPQLSAGSICLGEDRVLDHGLSGVSTEWNTGEISNTIIVTTENRYGVTVTNDATGCADTASVYLKVNTPPSVNLPNDQLPCEGETYLLGTGFDDVDYTNQWDGGSSASTGLIDVTITGEYRVIVTDIATKCSTKDTVIFTFLEVPIVDLGPDTNICAGDIITLLSAGVDLSYDFEWSTNEVSTSITVEESGTYSLEVSNGNCSDQDDVSITVHSLPESRLGNDTVVCFEDEPNGLSLDPGRVGNTYLWSTMETTQLININAPGTYVVGITNQVGCTMRDWVKVQEDCPSHVWLPNSFTPDGDGLNETWIINGRSIETVDVLVYNRWGELIWEGHALGDFWDGTHIRYANEVQQDVYVYHLKYTYLNIGGGQKSKSIIGTVTILR